MVMAEATGETTEALRRAMLPALPKMDTLLLQKALAVAKQDGGVDQKLIKTAEGKLSQAQKRASMVGSQHDGKREAALGKLMAAIEEA